MNAFAITLLVAATVFTITLTILYKVFEDKRLISKRIDRIKTTIISEVEKKKKRKKRQDGSVSTKIKILKRLENELSMSGILIRPSEFLIIWIGLTLIPAILLLALTSSFVVALAALLIGVFIPPFYVHTKEVKRVELFEKQLVDALAIICSCLKSGLTFQQALVSISTEMPEPISEEFGRIVRELKLGNTLEKSLTNLSEKLNSKNFMMIVSAILIQRETGGNLSEILTNLAGTIKERFAIKSEIKVLTTTGRTSGIIVGLMPIFIMLIFMLINPSYVLIFFETSLGIALLVIAVILEVIGFLFIRKIVNIKF